MAEYWYKKDKRVERISEQSNDKDVIEKVAGLKANGYVQIKDRHNPESVIKPKAKSKVKSKPKPKTAKTKKK